MGVLGSVTANDWTTDVLDKLQPLVNVQTDPYPKIVNDVLTDFTNIRNYVAATGVSHC